MENEKMVRVVIFKEADQWVAQCLEHDICVAADSMGDLYGRFEVAVRLESAEPGGLDRIGNAPQHFFELWDRRSGAFKPKAVEDGQFEFGVAA